MSWHVFACLLISSNIFKTNCDLLCFFVMVTDVKNSCGGSCFTEHTLRLALHQVVNAFAYSWQRKLHRNIKPSQQHAIFTFCPVRVGIKPKVLQLAVVYVCQENFKCVVVSHTLPILA